MIPDPEDAIRATGPWEHVDVAANGARFHVATAGKGPLVLLLHGFPTFWWTWRKLIPVLADAGYQAAAMDLRGYAGSDHTPRGYDPFNLSSDVVGVIRSLGHRDAIIIGHGWGGLLAWSCAALHPGAVRGIVPVSMPHPIRLRQALLSEPAQRRASSYVFGFQVPVFPERALLEDGASKIAGYLHEWSGSPDWPDKETADTYRAGMLLLNTAHCALEYHRWALRSIPRPDGIRFLKQLDVVIDKPVLHIQGGLDPTTLVGSSDGSGAWASQYRFEIMPESGHFPHEEQPDQFESLVMEWLGGLASANG